MRIKIIRKKSQKKPAKKSQAAVSVNKAGDIAQGKKQGLPWRKISKSCIYLAVFLLPLFFLPWTVNALDFNKQALLLCLALVSLFSWLLGCLSEGKIQIKLNYFHLPVLVFLAVLGLSVIFSAYPYASFWGLPLKIADSFITIFALVLLYFLIVNNFNKKEAVDLQFMLICSGAAASLLGLLQAFGAFLLPFGFSKTVSFNTVGTIRSLAVFGGCLLPPALLLCLGHFKRKKVFLMVSAAVILAFLLLVNFQTAWLCVLFGTALVLVFGIAKTGFFSPLGLNLIMTLFVVSLFFTFFRISVPFAPAIEVEVSPSRKASLDIAVKTLKSYNWPLSLFFGSGPGTFSYGYSLFKPEAINQSNFWSVRFNSAGSEILDRLTTSGLAGGLAFFGLLGTAGFLAVKQLIKEQDSKKAGLELTALSGWLALAIGSFFYSFNFCLVFLFWILSALIIVSLKTKVKTWNLEPSSLAAISASFVFVLSLVLGLGLLFSASQRYVAQVKYFEGLRALQKGETEMAVNNVAQAANLCSGKQDSFWRDLCQLYIVLINQEFQRQDLSQEEMLDRITPLMANTIVAAKASTDASPGNVANWTIRGFVYSQLSGLVPGAEQWAITSLEQALKLEPNNPSIFVELGKAYLLQGSPEKAKEQFQKAIDLKADFAPAHYQIALLHQAKGETDEAIDRLQLTQQITGPSDVAVAFQLGILYYNSRDYEEAQAEMERVAAFAPQNSNARYLLGLVYDQTGAKSKAIEQFEIVAEMNPDNQEVAKILSNLRAGQSALAGIIPSEPPIEETPPERIEE